MKLLKVTHANLGTPMYLAHERIAGIYFSQAQNCTYIVANAGAIFPARESVDEVNRLLETEEGTSNEDRKRPHD